MGRKKRSKARVVTRATTTTPGFEGMRELEAGVVDSPFRRGEKEDVVLNIRVSNSTTMLRRGQITEAQKMAWDRYTQLHDMMRMSSMVVDPFRAGARDSVAAASVGAERILRASEILGKLKQELGIARRIVEWICGQGYSVREAAQLEFCTGMNGKPWRAPTAKEAETAGMIFRMGLDKMTHFFGYATSETLKTEQDALMKDLKVGLVGIAFRRVKLDKPTG